MSLARLHRLLGKAKSALSKGPVLQPDADDSIKADLFDRELWNEISQMPALQQETQRLADSTAYSDHTMRDVFLQLWQAAPQLREASEMLPDHVLNHAIASDLQNSPDLQRLRESTQHDKYGAAFGMLGIAERVEQVAKAQQEAKKAQEEAAQRRKEEAATQSALATLLAEHGTNDAGQPGGGDGQQGGGEAGDVHGPTTVEQDAAAQSLADAVAAAEAAAAATAAAEAAAAAAHAQASAALRAKVNEAATQAADDLEEQAEAAAAWGVQPGELKQMDFASRRALADRLADPNLKRYLAAIGRWKMRAAGARARRTDFGRDDITGVELSDDLARITGAEMAKMRHPKLKRDFLLRYSEGQLLSYKFEGRERVGKGPIICCIDSSGSMSGSRDQGAKGLALALLDQARAEKRSFVGINFGSRTELSIHHLDPQHYSVDEAIAFVTRFFGGGTDFQTPLSAALKIMQADGKKKSDIVFITDGSCRVSDQWKQDFLEAKALLAFRMFAIVIGSHDTRSLEPLADDVRSVQNLDDPGVAADLFATI